MRAIGWLSAAALAVAAAVAAGCVKTVKDISVTAVSAAGAEQLAEPGVLFESADPSGASRLAFVDPRDGQRYPAVRIGRGVWMARNLDYAAEGSSCLEDSAVGCVKYGRLYNWYLAQTACPVGWHLSTPEEWDSLMTAAGGERGTHGHWESWTAADKKLKAKSGWDAYWDDDVNNKIDGNGTDDYGFAALPADERYSPCGGMYEGPGDKGTWWMSKEYDGHRAYMMEMRQTVSLIYPTFKEQGHSVRCVSDDGVTVKAGAGGAFTLTLNAGT